ncbi:MAG: KpsF/GutQ family sugar-phosphate isomerase [Alphaproteobacteria bacterium]|nr:KpsF/GutQ family sugar-phosphate isomerase [Alphaproteobacteria bacterium]
MAERRANLRTNGGKDALKSRAVGSGSTSAQRAGATGKAAAKATAKGKKPARKAPGQKVSKNAALEAAQRTLKLESSGLGELREALAGALSQAFIAAVETIAKARGRVIVSGIGKSGHIGQKIAATFASTGTPAFFVHPSEASHGDLGMITREDVILAISWSGESVELSNIIAFSRRFKVPLIAITSRKKSTLGSQADVCLDLPRSQEACPHGLAPTTSTTMQLAVGDCLAIALLETKGFTAHDFKVFHPGGSLGASLKYVADLMHTGEEMPIAADNVDMTSALVTMTQKAFGCLGIVDKKGRLVGVITDGDLRRNMGDKLLRAKTGEVMTKNPKTVTPGTLASAALETMNASRITALFVVDKGKPAGVVHVHDMLRAGVV